MKHIPGKKNSAHTKKKQIPQDDSSNDEGSTANGTTPIYVNGVEIDIEAITDQELIELRKVLPRK